MSSWIISIGAGLYWASRTVSYLQPQGTTVDFAAQSLAGLVIAVVALVAAPYLVKRHLSALSGIALGMHVISLVGILVSVLARSAVLPTVVPVILSCFGSPLLMLLWGVQFAGVGRAQAFAEVARAILITLVTHCAIIGFVGLSGVGEQIVQIAIPVLDVLSSAALVGTCRLRPMRIEVREFRKESRPTFLRFVFSRLLLGLVTGGLIGCAGVGFSEAQMSSSSSGLALVLCAAGIGLLAVLILNPGASGSALLPLMPLSAGCAIDILALPAGLPAQAVLCLSVWLAWIIMSSVQLSELKYEFGMSEFFLVFFEKVVMLLAMSIGYAVALALAGWVGALDREAILMVCCLLTLASLFYASATLLRLAQARGREDVVREVVTVQDDQLGYIYDTIARDFSLSERESEIMRYLARGHTRVYISNELDIAPGTVKAHIGHIYRKIGCHSKEEVLALVRHYTTFNE